jgi:hypothetical protein
MWLNRKAVRLCFLFLIGAIVVQHQITPGASVGTLPPAVDQNLHLAVPPTTDERGPNSPDSGVGSPNPTDDQAFFPPDEDSKFTISNDIGLIMINMSQAVFDSNFSPELLKNLHVINSEESIESFLETLAKGIKTVWKKVDTDVSTKASGGGGSNKLIFGTAKGSTSSEARYNKKDYRRPSAQEEELGNKNCYGNQFDSFANKHIKVTHESTLESEYASLAFWESHVRRASGPVTHSTIFFVPRGTQPGYHYVERQNKPAVCVAQDFYDTYTCVRRYQSDAFLYCSFNGKCKPSYEKTGSHLRSEDMECLAGSGDITKDVRASPETLIEVHKAFVEKMFHFPTQHGWNVAIWNNDRESARRRKETFDVPRPVAEPTERESVWNSHKEFKKANPDYEIPASVLDLFYYQPYTIFGYPVREDTSDPTATGIPRWNRLNTVNNPLYKDLQMDLVPTLADPPFANVEVEPEVLVEVGDELQDHLEQGGVPEIMANVADQIDNLLVHTAGQAAQESRKIKYQPAAHPTAQGDVNLVPIIVN